MSFYGPATTTGELDILGKNLGESGKSDSAQCTTSDIPSA
jgi:hypothetical protein